MIGTDSNGRHRMAQDVSAPHGTETHRASMTHSRFEQIFVAEQSDVR